MHRVTDAQHEATPSRRDFLKASTALAGAMAGAGLAVAPIADAAEPSAARAAAQPPTGTRPAAPAASLPARRAKRTFPHGCPPAVRAALSGPWPSVRTPFTRHGDLDLAALRKHVDFLIEAKAKAIVLTAGDSLFSLLTEDEIARLTKAVVEQVARRALVVVADGSWATPKEVEFAKYCVEIGADMLMVKPPDWAASTTVASLVAHYRAVAEHLPVMLVTNYLGSRGQAFGLGVIRALYEQVPGVMAVKDDVGGEFICKACLMTHDRWALSAGGQKSNHLLVHPYGAGGYLSTFLTFKPEIAWRYWKAIQSNNLAAARDVIRDYDMPLFQYLLASEGSFDAAIHGIYELFGLASRYRRPPYHSLNDRQMEALADFLRSKRIL